MSAAQILKLMKSAVVLSKPDYSKWCDQFRDVLILLDVVEYIDDSIPQLKTRNTKNVSTEDLDIHKKDQNVRVAISRLVPDTAHHLVGPSFTARECWDNLKEFFCPNPSEDIDDLLQEFWGLTVEDDEDVDEFFQRLTNVRNRIHTLDNTRSPPDSSVKKRIISHFQKCCNGFFMSIIIPLKDPEVTLTKTLNTIRSSQATYRELQPNPMVALTKANNFSTNISDNMTSSEPSSPEINEQRSCAFCHKKNHIRERCFLWLDTPDGTKWAAKNPKKASETRKLQQKLNKNKSKKNKETAVGAAWVLEDNTLNLGSSNKFRDVVLDTGATNHIFCDKAMFSTILPANKSVSTASGDYIPVSGVGSVSFEIFSYDDAKKCKTITVQNVWYVPSCTKNLISGTQLISRGFQLKSSTMGLSVISKNGQLLATARPKGGLFCFNTCNLDPSFSSSFKLDNSANSLSVENAGNSVTKLIHHRFAHVSPQLLEKIDVASLEIPALKAKTESKLHIDREDLKVCEVCNSCKQVEKINRFPAERSSSLLELIHSDTWGKCRVPGIFGGLYFVTFTDDASRESELCLMKTKTEVSNCFRWYKEKKELKTNHRVKAMRFDGGSEYKNIDFGGITQQISAPYTQHQNGVSERLNRSIITMARCMLSHARLPLRFWDAAVLAACYLRNRMPILPGHKTPYEVMNGSLPKISHLKVWGCICYVLIQSTDPNRYKLLPTSMKGIFVGYCESITQYRVYIPSKPGVNKVVLSANVKFLENSFWDWQLSSSDQPAELLADQRDAPLSRSINKGSTISTGWSSSSDSESSPPRTTSSRSMAVIDPLSISPPSSPVNEEIDQSDTMLPVEPKESRKKLVSSGFGSESTLRRSERIRKEIEPRSAWQPSPRTFYVEGSIPTPQTYSEAINGLQQAEWKLAIKEELDSLENKKVFTPVIHIPDGRRPVGSRWVFTIKSDGRFKARLVAQGFSQEFGVDYHETYSPTLRTDSLRILLAVAAFRDWEIHQVDVKTAFLEGDLNEEIYMKSPEGMSSTKYVRVNKSLYGLKQSGRAWYQKLDEKMSNLKFIRSKADECVYINSEKLIFVGVYVDDLIICGKFISDVAELKSKLASFFPIKDLGLIDNFIGWKITRDRENRSLKICQSSYILEKIQSFGLQDAKHLTSPLDGYSGILPRNEEENQADESAYASAVGSLGYAANGTRPDIAFSTSQLGRFNSNPSQRHWNSVCRVFRYLKGTHNYCLTYYFGPVSNKVSQNEKMTAFSDSDYASDIISRRSVSGYIMMLGGGPVSWQSRRQKSISTSTAEAEYVALFEAAKQIIWIKRLLEELHVADDLIGESLLTLTDNQSAIAIANGTNSTKTKHIDVAYHFVRECVTNGIINLRYIPSSRMLADVLTKPLAYPKLKPLCQEIFGICT